MLKKSQEEPQQSSNRTKLPRESGIRSLAGIKELLAMAETSRGCQIELEWTSKNPGQTFVLDVQWDANMDDPSWALYEENAGESKQVWSQSFAAIDIEMFYDILVMSCGAVDPSRNLSDILKSHTNSPKEDYSKPVDKPGASSTTSANSSQGAASNLSSSPSTAAPVPNPAPGANPGFAPPYGFPPAVAVPINPAVAFPMPAYNMPPGIQAVPVFPAMPGMPAPGMQTAGWQYNPGMNSNVNVYGQPVIDPSSQSSGTLSSLPIDTSLLNKEKDIALVDLLVKAQLLTEPILAAALKIQDLIQDNKLSVERASEILNHYHSKGGAIEDYINSASDSLVSSIVEKSSFKNSGRRDVNKREDPSVLAAFELLKKGGLLSEDDIKIAEGVRRKHGGDLVAILKAANKIDENTLEAAKICQALEKDGKMKLEQSVIVLNYCSRSRVSFDEAMSELNWENPHQLKK